MLKVVVLWVLFCGAITAYAGICRCTVDGQAAALGHPYKYVLKDNAEFLPRLAMDTPALHTKGALNSKNDLFVLDF